MLLSRELLQTVEDIAVCAGELILEVYSRSGAVEVSSKVDDYPLTEADLRVNTLIIGELMRLFPQLPILSYEPDAVSFAECG